MGFCGLEGLGEFFLEAVGGVSCGVVEGGLSVWGEDERSGAEEEGHSVISLLLVCLKE